MGPVKPSDKAARLNRGAFKMIRPNMVSGGCLGSEETGPTVLNLDDNFPPLNKTGPTKETREGDVIGSATGSSPAIRSKSVVVSFKSGLHPVPPQLQKIGPASSLDGPKNNLKSINPTKAMVDNLREKSRGCGFFDVSQNNFGPRQNKLVETKSSFGKLQDEEDCFDTEHGLCEKDMLIVRKFFETNTCYESLLYYVDKV
ncbi:hypothetical protein Hanom_Chr07g00635041 [Helianthus anomalus]